MAILLRYFKREPLLAGITALFIAAASGLRVTHALINTYTYNSLIALDMAGFFRYILLDLGVFAILSVILGFGQYIRAKAVQQLSLDLRRDITQQLEQRSVTEFSSQNTGTYASWLTNDMTLIERNGFDNLFDFVQIITDPLFSLIALVHFHWSFLPVVFLLSFFTVLLPQIIHKQLAKANLSTTKSNEHLLGIINDALRGFSTFAIFGMQRQLSQRIANATQELIGHKLHQVRYEALANNVAGLSNIVGQMLVEGWTGFLALQKFISIGVIGSSANLAYNVFNSIAVFAPVLTQMQALTPVLAKYNLNADHSKDSARVALPTNTPVELVADELTFHYPDSTRPVFAPFSLQLHHGDKIALTGESGTGKSTILKIIAGQLSGYQGSLTLDGVEIRDCQPASLNQVVLYIDQTPYLFNDTIRYNLELGEHFSDAELQAALERADLWQEIQALPQGLATVTGEAGQGLSGGQRQRLALARGLLRHQQLFLFDESTSSLSKSSALRVENNFLAQADLTLIFVSHQLHAENQDQFQQIIQLDQIAATE